MNISLFRPYVIFSCALTGLSWCGHSNTAFAACDTYDLAVNSVSARSPLIITPGTPITFTVLIENVGTWINRIQ